ncbi:MAG: ribosome maturation factor RimP [Deferribacterales bacterium]
MKNPANKIVIEKIRPAIVSLLKEKGFELFDITLRSESTGKVLRITIDTVKGAGIDDCSEASRLVSAFLDSDESLIPFENYMLEVSTPGLMRPLRSQDDFVRYKGRKCKIITKTKDESGRASYTGVIKNAAENSVELFVEKENKTFNINIENISKANLEVEF